MGTAGHFRVEEESGALDGMSLDEYLVDNPAASFVMNIDTDALAGDGVMRGDMAVVDRSLDARSGDIVIAVEDGAYAIKKFDDLASSRASESGQSKVEAVVVAIVRKYR